jgi:hypothetical protein
MADIAIIETKADDAVVAAESYEINSMETFKAASDVLKSFKALTKEINESFDPIIKQAHKAHKEAIAQRDKHLKPVKAAEKIMKKKIADYNAILEAERKAEQARLDEEARVEREKRMQEALKASEAADQQAAMGDMAGAAEIQREAQEMAEKAVEIKADKAEKEKVEGLSFREVWKAEITDSAAVPREWCIPDESAIKQFAKATKGKQSIPGVRIYCDKVPITRS